MSSKYVFSLYDSVITYLNRLAIKMLIISSEFKCSKKILAITAMLSAPIMWICPANGRKEAGAAKALLTVPDGDHRALALAVNVRAQLGRTMQKFDVDLLSLNDEKKLYAAIWQVLICGLFIHVAHKEGENGQSLDCQRQLG